jgi:nitrite reductase/ring-hydroxylating ferredoxin subunit
MPPGLSMTWRAVGTLGDAERAGPWLQVSIDGDDFVLASHDGRWFAVEDHCSHAGCPFSSEATLDGGTIVCNCHGSEFQLATGEVLRGPAEYPIRSVAVRVSGDAIELDI